MILIAADANAPRQSAIALRRHGHGSMICSGLCGLFLLSVMAGAAAAGTWREVIAQNPEFYNSTMVLLTDGSVMVHSELDYQTWTQLTPDSTGSYENGTWKTLARMSIPRLNFAVNVLPDGRVLVLGGEYSGPFLDQNFTNTGEIYNPVTNKWSSISPYPEATFGDCPTVLLSAGYILAGSPTTAESYLYYPPADFWFSFLATKLRDDTSQNETWLLLPDGSVLSYDIFASITSGTASGQRFGNSFSWVDSGTLPNLLSTVTQNSQLGPGSVLPDGKVLYVGANENTAIYTPPASSFGTGSWVDGPALPAGVGAGDAPGAMLPDGHFLFLADFYVGNPPVMMFDYNSITNTLTDISATLPFQLQFELLFTPASRCRMLLLPNGRMLFNTSNSSLWEYTPTGSPQNAWKPTISSLAKINSRQYRLTGARLTGISEGATGGDNVSTNYPIIRLVKSGVVRYVRSSNWSPRVSRVGDTSLQSVDFDIPAGLPAGVYQVTVIANGIPSLAKNLAYAPPKVTASFANGTLKIIGDVNDNNIVVTYKQVKVSGVLKSASATIKAGDAYTTVNGKTSETLDVGTQRFRLYAQMGNGNDTVAFSSLFLTNLNCYLGDGDDSANFLYNSITTQMTVDGGAGFDTLTRTGNSIKKQTITNIP